MTTNTKPASGTSGAGQNSDNEMQDKNRGFSPPFEPIKTIIPIEIVKDADSECEAEKTSEPQSKAEKTSEPQNILAKLIASNEKILEAAKSNIVFTPAWVQLGPEQTPIFSKGTINVIQGKAGVHKSRLAETFCSLLLSKDGKGDFCGFERYNLGAGYYVAYIDTERNSKEHFPAAVQRIRERAGLDRIVDNGHLYPVSIKDHERKDRLEAVKAWIEHVRSVMKEKGVSEWNLFVVLDVVTDCTESFNNETQTMRLFDYLGNLCEDQNVTFLLVIHENPGSEKARGHAGTEAMNKADCQIQIAYESGSNGEETDLIKIRFLKTRNAARPKPLFLQYSKERNGLVTADAESVANHMESRKKNTGENDLIEALEDVVFNGKDEIPQKKAVDTLTEKIGKTANTIKTHLDNLINRGVTIKSNGKKCQLTKEVRPGKPTVYRLVTQQNDTTQKIDPQDEEQTI